MDTKRGWTRSTWLYVPARKSSVMRRASGSADANVGLSPNPSKAAAMGTRARRMAAVPLRPTVTTRRSPWCSTISFVAKRMVFVLSDPARPRSVVNRTSSRVATFAAREERMVLIGEHRGDVRQDLVELVAVGARLEGRVLGTLELGRSHELHRAGDLLDVLDRADAASDLALAGHELVGASVMRVAMTGGSRTTR